MSSTDTANRLSCGRPSSPGPLPRGGGVQLWVLPGSAHLTPSSAARTGSCRAISTAAGTFSESPDFQPGINLPRPLFPCYFQILSPLWRCQGPSAPLPSCPSGWFLASLQRTARPPLLPVETSWAQPRRPVYPCALFPLPGAQSDLHTQADLGEPQLSRKAGLQPSLHREASLASAHLSCSRSNSPGLSVTTQFHHCW